MFQRSRKTNASKQQSYIVIGAFVGVCVLSVLYVLLNPKKSFAAMAVIDESAMLVHNGQQANAFQRGENTFFQVCGVTLHIALIILTRAYTSIELDHLQCQESFR